MSRKRRKSSKSVKSITINRSKHVEFEQDYKNDPEYQKKSWSIHDIKPVKPLNDRQQRVIDSFYNNSITVALGAAGTGKSYLSLALAYTKLFTGDYSSIRVIRSIVPTRDIGFLPGTEEEKSAVYELPYVDITKDLLKYTNSWRDLKRSGKVQFTVSSFVRGLTWDNQIIIIEEAQNMTFHEFSSILTRVGVNSKVIITGDTHQNDLQGRRSEKSGIAKITKVLESMYDAEVIMFRNEDIVRSGVVREFLVTVSELTSRGVI